MKTSLFFLGLSLIAASSLAADNVAKPSQTFSTLQSNSSHKLNSSNECGPGDWQPTGSSGPFGYNWYYERDKSTGSLTDASSICGNFYNTTNNCYKPMDSKNPPQYGNFKYKSCNYNTGLYSIDAINATNGQETTTICQNC